MKPITIFLSVILLHSMAGGVVADIDWTNDGDGRLWRNSANWFERDTDTSRLPESDDKVAIRHGGDGPIVDSHTSAWANDLVVGDWGQAGSVDVNGGTLTTSGWIISGFGNNDQGTLNISGGTVTCNRHLTVGHAGEGHMSMSNGTVTVSGRFGIATNGGAGHVQLDGGAITCNSFSMSNGATMDITEGILVVNGDVRDTIHGYVQNGWITAYEDAGALGIEYDSSDNTTRVIGNEGDVPLIPRQVVLTWQGDTSTTMTVTWRTDSFYPKQARLFYSDDEALSLQDYNVKEADSYTFEPSRAVIHTAELTGLQPATEYYVVIDHPSEPESFKFRTAPVDREEIVFLAGGDSRPPGVETRRIINAMAAAEEPDFIIFAGDFINIALSESQWDDWFDDWHEQLITEDGRRIPIIPAIGNHEVDGGYRKTKAHAPYYYNRFLLPDAENYYILNYGPDLLIVTLDSDHTMRVENQNEWLEQTLYGNQHYPLKIVQYHVAAWPSVRSMDGIPSKIRQNWVPLFEKYGVDVVVEAHDHAYKLTEPIKNGQVHPDGVIYTGDGGWGAPTREVRDAEQYWWLKEAVSIDHFWKFTLSENGHQLHVEPIFYGDPGEDIGTTFTIDLQSVADIEY